jgi:TatD DNase family protein
MWFDSHCHLDSENCSVEQRDAVLARARAAGVERLVTVGVGGPAAMREAVALSEASGPATGSEQLEPRIWATAGVHPHDAESFDPELETLLRECLARPRVVALGEVGLDYHYDHSPRARQREVFARMIALARELRKPLVIHTREAAADTLEILSAEGAREVGGIIHCFSEDREFARRVLELDFDLSFSGIATFKSARSIQDVAAWAPPERVLLETDSPYLSPVPLRGKRCEPAFVVHTARRLAELRGIALERVAELTTANAVRRFGVD